MRKVLYLRPVLTLEQLARISAGISAHLIEEHAPRESDASTPEGTSLLVTSTDYHDAGWLKGGGGRQVWLAKEIRTRYLLKPQRDVLYLIRGANQRACEVPQLKTGGPQLIPSDHFARLRITHPGELDPGYLHAYLNGTAAQRFGESRLIDGAMPHLPIRQLAQMPIPLPSIERQRAIARLARLQRDATLLTHRLEVAYAELLRGSLQDLSDLQDR